MSVPAHPANSPMPTTHERLSWEQAETFGSWLDAQLEQLERDYAEYITVQSIKSSLKSETSTRR